MRRPLALLVLMSGCAQPQVEPEPWDAYLQFDLGSERWLPQGSPDGNEYKRGNTFGMTVAWSGPGESARVTVNLRASRHRGAATNSGDDILPDAFFEDELNPDWTFPPDYTPKIDGVQVLKVSTVLRIGQSRRLVVSCFDWAATFSLEATAMPGP